MRRVRKNPVDCLPDDRMHRVRLPGQRLSSSDFDRQVAKFQARIAVLNGFTAGGIPVTEAPGQVCPAEKRASALS